MRNARRAVNYNLPAQLPGTTTAPLEPYTYGVEEHTEVRPEDFGIDMVVSTEANDGNEA